MKLFYLNQTGRSMIEMIGVLAIVGILSVGSIAGYSKAMYTYKVNKLTEEFVLFLNNFLHFKTSLLETENTGTNVATILSSLKIIPETWSVKGIYIYDSTSRQFRPFIRNKNKFIAIDYTLKLSEKDSAPNMESRLLCQNIWLKIIKLYDESIYRAFVWRGSGNDYSLECYGKSFCNNIKRKCISDVTISDIISACDSCLEESKCILAIDFNK